MSVVLDTSLGNITIKLFCDDCPVACKSFLKLCKIKYYNNCLFYNIQKDYIVQTGDPTNTGRGGQSIYGILYGEQAKYFEDEIRPHLRHKKIGTVAMANTGPNLNGSAFYITTAENLTSLDNKHTIFGEVVEGLDTLAKLNEAYTDSEGRPVQIIRIRHTYILSDPFDDPPELKIPDRSPEPAELPEGLLPEGDLLEQTEPDEVIKEKLEEKTAKARAEVLEIIGDIPDADMKPPENVLFVCKLNPATTDEDLALIFSRFGEILSCEIIRDKKTGDSLCYAFIEFKDKESCEQAYFKMNNVLIDDRRIHVDFSQSIGKIDRRKFGNWRDFYAARAFDKNREKSSKSKPAQSGFAALELKGSRYRGDTGDRGKYSLLMDSTDTGLPPSSSRHKRDRQHDFSDDRSSKRHRSDRSDRDRSDRDRSDRDRSDRDRSERDRSDRDRSDRDRSDRYRSDRDRSDRRSRTYGR